MTFKRLRRLLIMLSKYSIGISCPTYFKRILKHCYKPITFCDTYYKVFINQQEYKINTNDPLIINPEGFNEWNVDYFKRLTYVAHFDYLYNLEVKNKNIIQSEIGRLISECIKDYNVDRWDLLWLKYLGCLSNDKQQTLILEMFNKYPQIFIPTEYIT